MAREKKVYTSVQDIAHKFAHQEQYEARNPSGNFYFEGDTIYSYGYHFPIATHVTGKNGQKAVAFTTDSYRNTTAKHISVVHRALFQDVVLCYDPRSAGRGFHRTNIDHMILETKNILAHLTTARKPEKYLAQAEQVLSRLDKYCEFFGVKLRKEDKEVYKIRTKEDYQALVQKVARAAKRAQNKYRKEAVARFQKEIAEWRTGERRVIHLPSGISEDLLRANTEDNCIETSQGIQIPMEVAKNFYYLVKETLKKGGCESCDTKLLQYDVKSIDKKGIRIGCHYLLTEEYETIAKQLNW